MSEQEKAEQQKKEEYYGSEEYYANEIRIEEHEDECDFNGEECINPHLHHCCGCIGCEVIAPPSKEELEECTDNCEDCSSLEVEEDSHGLRYPICHKKEEEKK